MEVSKDRKEKSAPISESAALRLVDLYIRDEKKYNSRLVGGSKKGKSPRDQCLVSWQEDLSSMGCDRSVEQIYARIRGDLIFVRSLLTSEKAERGKTGGGLPKKPAKLGFARSKLYEHLQGSHIVNGMSGGIESGPVTKEPLHETLEDCRVDYSNEPDDSSSHSLEQDPSLELIKDSEPSSSNFNKQSEVPKTFSALMKTSRKRPAQVSVSLNDVNELRSKLLEAELEVARKKARNMDEEYSQLLRKSEILKVKHETAELKKMMAMSKAKKLGIANPAP